MFFTMTATIPSTTINIPRKNFFKRRLIKIKNNKTIKIKVFCLRIWHASEISRRISSNKQFISGLQTGFDVWVHQMGHIKRYLLHICIWLWQWYNLCREGGRWNWSQAIIYIQSNKTNSSNLQFHILPFIILIFSLRYNW